MTEMSLLQFGTLFEAIDPILHFMLLGVILLAAVPLWLHAPREDEELFMGTDGQAQELIRETHPGYEPWYAGLWEPPSGEIESLLFALQAALGSGLVFYCLGYYRGRHVQQSESPRDAPG
jgi:cobalt/nickel transport protein